MPKVTQLVRAKLEPPSTSADLGKHFLRQPASLEV